MHTIVGYEFRRYFEGQAFSKISSVTGNGSEQSPDILRQSGEIAKCAPEFQVPDLFENGDRRLAVCLTERDSFENARAWNSIAGAVMA